MAETTEIQEKLPKLRPRLKKLAEFLISGETQIEAYKKAGYKAKNANVASVQMHRLLELPIVADYIRIRQDQIAKELQKQTEATIIRTVIELARLAYVDPKQMYDDNGNLKQIKDMDEATRRAIASIEEVQTKSGKALKIKLWNKNDALKTIAGHLGMLNERKELTGGLKIEVLYHKDGEEGKTSGKLETGENGENKQK